MGVRVDVLPREDEHGSAVMLTRPGAPTSTSLEYEAPLAGGVRLRVDLARPTDWRCISIAGWKPNTVPLVRLLVGDRAARDLDALGRDPHPYELAVDSRSAEPWVRAAVIHGLDRWLQLPLAQDLLHAEIGVATFRAARGLPAGSEIRETLVDEALGWTRRASTGVVDLFRRLTAARRPVPPALRRAAEALVDGYASLRELISEPDGRLSEVVESGNAFRHAPTDQTVRARNVSTAGKPDSDPVSRAVGLIDPRHVRARVLRLGDEPQTAEIGLSPTRIDGEDAVRIQVPAFERLVDPEIALRLMARLVDRTSGRDHSFAALTVRGRPSLFECTIPLQGSDLKSLRADVFDALFHPRGLPEATEDELVRVRRAVLELRESRRLVAQAELRGKRQTGPGQPLVAELAAAYEGLAA